MEWFQLFDAQGACIFELLAFTAKGALRDARDRGISDAYTARRLHPYEPQQAT